MRWKKEAEENRMEQNVEDNKIEKFKRRYDKILKKKETSEGNKK